MSEHDVYPRGDERERFRLYVLRPGDDGAVERHVVCTTPTAEGLGLALVTMAAEGELDGCPVGVLDAVEGKWIVNPYDCEHRWRL